MLDERPRDRLLRFGPRALTDAELLGVLICPDRSSGAAMLDAARTLLRENGGLAGLIGAHSATLRRHGIGAVKLTVLLAAVELASRLAQSQVPERDPLTRPEEVARYLSLRYAQRDQEVVGALYLDRRNRLLSERELFRGTLSRAAVEPREILKEALLRGAAGVVLFHTHPSGDPSPSIEDLLVTRRLSDAGELVGVRLVDHLVLGSPSRWASLMQQLR